MIISSNDDREYHVLVNEHGDYCLWPVPECMPHGWTDTGSHGRIDDCLAFVPLTWMESGLTLMAEEMNRRIVASDIRN
jgi:uncharacterized protein YbdZ (MbtH family)